VSLEQCGSDALLELAGILVMRSRGCAGRSARVEDRRWRCGRRHRRLVEAAGRVLLVGGQHLVVMVEGVIRAAALARCDGSGGGDGAAGR
jgi:hypothetical protein